ncbi:CYTH domain-containing protein [Deinococcus hopiensis]|uniref:Adenylate cyclase n=1 Tax=Deinococcus hopiensis KR-140 TaxID=695939 RepID=A0A1W1UAK1_9DEIO|nr:CYTH domain-containing protein [Deinococcus hopiensis]SMB78083.1 adenylate cyclase [Deinococcus hopiensis KR-140]
MTTLPTEIERKFLVNHAAWAAAGQPEGQLLSQGYLSQDPERTVRIRLQGDEAWITVKGQVQGLTRAEFEYAIPPGDAAQMLETLTLSALSKRRTRVFVGAHVWDVDVFLGSLTGLILAEVELSSEDEPFVRPEWLGQEVSHDPRYFNSALARSGVIPDKAT